MRFATRRQTDSVAIPAGDARRRRTRDDDDEPLIETPGSPFEDLDQLTNDDEGAPSDRRRDPLRKNW